MEKLAAAGTRFSQFYAHSVCSPTRASIMTGQNSARHRTTNWIKPQSNNRGNFGPAEWNWTGVDKTSITYHACCKGRDTRPSMWAKPTLAQITTKAQSLSTSASTSTSAAFPQGSPAAITAGEKATRETETQDSSAPGEIPRHGHLPHRSPHPGGESTHRSLR